MNIESFRDFCLSLPNVTEDFPFDDTTLVFRVGGKIFAIIDLVDTEWFVLKCNPDYAITLRETHNEIVGAWHMNKKYWITKSHGIGRFRGSFKIFSFIYYIHLKICFRYKRL